MNTEEIIKKSESLIQWLDKKIDGLDVSSDERTRLAGACLDMALEHQKAIVLLVANKIYGSSFALARLLFDAYVRGVWLHLCASKSEIQGIGDVPRIYGLQSANYLIHGRYASKSPYRRPWGVAPYHCEGD